jgi:hypothetical protein
MTELECQIEQDNGNYFILYIVVQRALEERNSILYIEGEKCMIFPKVQFVARGRSTRATKHRGKNEHSLQKYICYGQRR